MKVSRHFVLPSTPDDKMVYFDSRISSGFKWDKGKS